jgi:O-methyltransferase involved in polyketide biosynthesis
MKKLQPDDLQGVSETLLIPLHFRVEQSRSGGGGFKDEVAERFHDAIAYEWDKLETRPLQRTGMAVRTNVLDEQVRAFLAGGPDGLIVNLGAGLDTRFYRVDNGGIQWVELDLPEVIAFRRSLHEPEDPRHVLLAGSILDDAWVSQAKQYGTARVLLVAEGLLPYFTQEQHVAIFSYLADSFPGQQMLFQTISPSLISGLPGIRRYSNLRRMRTHVDVRWGLDDSALVSALNPKVRLVAEFPLLEGREALLPAEFREKLTAGALSRISKILAVRFDQ